MAASDSELDVDLEEQAKALTTCSICLDRFTYPKVLPCQHTFCLSCLKCCYDAVNSQRLVPLSNFPCPSCRKVCYVPQGGLEQLATDFKIGQILDLMTAIESSIHSQQKNNVPGFGRCSICCFQKREKLANSFCLQCEKAFCDQCLSHHAKTKIFSDHVVIGDNNQSNEARENLDKCLDHEASFKYFCEDCSTLLCTVCMFSEHGDHSVMVMERAADTLDARLSKFADDLNERIQKLNDARLKVDTLKRLLLERKDDFEAGVEATYEDALKMLQDSKMQLLSEARTSYNYSMVELANVEQSIEGSRSSYHEKYDAIVSCRSQKGGSKFFLDFENAKKVLANLQQLELKTPSLEKIKFIPALSVSIGKIEKKTKGFDLTAVGAIAADDDADEEPQKKEQTNDKENQESSKKVIPQLSSLSYGKPLKATRLHVNIQSGSQDKACIKKDQLKPGSSDKVIQGLGRRLSGRLTAANFQQASQAGASALSPIKRKMNWIAEGFSQCRDCCFMKMPQQWLVAASDYRATSAGDRIKIFDLKGRQQSVISVRTIVEPWSLTYMQSSNSFMVTDHSSRAIKMINLDENGRCSKVTTMYQSYADKPSGICQLGSGKFVVTDVGSRNHRLSAYSMNSNFLDKKIMFGKKGSVDGEVLLSNYVAANSSDQVIVSDYEANCIKVFSPLDGTQLLKFSCSCSFEGGRDLEPQGVAVDDSNNILIADQATNSVVMFSSEGQLIGNVAHCKGKPWGISYADELRMLAVATDKGLEVFEL